MVTPFFLLLAAFCAKLIREVCHLWVNVLQTLWSKWPRMNLIDIKVNKHVREVELLGIMWQKRQSIACCSIDIISPENVCEGLADTKVSGTSA